MLTEDMLLADVMRNLPPQLELLTDVKSPWNNTEQFRWYDGYLQLVTPDGRRFPFYYEIKSQPQKNALMLWKQQINEHLSENNGLLICQYLTPGLQNYCVENYINFIDSAGNAFIFSSGMFLHITGRKHQTPLKKTNRISIGVMKLLFVLLSDEKIINYSYREIAGLAGISLGMVSKGFDYLADNNLYRDGRQGRRFTDLNEVYSLWLREYGSALRPKLSCINLSGETPWQTISLLPGEYWGGEVTAYTLSKGYLKPEIIQIFTPLPFSERRKMLDLKPHPSGQYQLIETFWGKAFNLNERAQTLLAIAELIVSQDSRNIEIARDINERYLHIKAAII